ncbi:MAG: UDP-N-acetylmuramoyl-L-alanine--D-glutamate ligase [Acutalibacteraceae bacterium]|nr:UDP-N-acetylmuramoyl-L-alanine--D-glutamate ligase [Acutalibacteraceae bacterium]
MDLSGKKVLVVGLARSGMAAIRVLKKLGAEVTLSESKKKDDIKEIGFLNENNVEIVGQDMAVFERDFDFVVKNPGVPYRSPMMQKLQERNIPVITEIELAYQVAKPQHYIAITGTNGKTTTSTLTYEILRRAFPGKAHLCGNIGIPLCEIVMENGLMEEGGHYIALEISNFQLVNIDKFRPEVATIINLTPDHIDFMGSLDNYYKSKTEVYRNMADSDVFLLNADDPVVKEYTDRYPVKCAKESFSTDSQSADCIAKDGYLEIKGEKIIPLNAIKIVGKHNLQNVMIAVSAAKAIGISNDVILEAVSSFKGVEHRIEFVREIDGVKYYNDSKGTNTDATITALKAFDRGVILLVGGFEKGLPMDEMKKHLGCVKKIIGFGACGARLVHDLVGEDGIVVTTLDEAVAEANKIAESGDTVLLSPTTSSFDQYTCFEERGDHFKKIINAL